MRRFSEQRRRIAHLALPDDRLSGAVQTVARSADEHGPIDDRQRREQIDRLDPRHPIRVGHERRIVVLGRDQLHAARDGTAEIGLAVMATTLSLIAVFLPIAFVSGIPGRFLGSFGITMSFAIAVS